MFDALLHARSLGRRDLADLRFFGVQGGLVPSDDAIPSSSAASVRAGWEEVSRAVARLRRAGLAAWGALGVHPRRIPLRGLEALLADLPGALGRPEIAAVGAVGLDAGGELEVRVLSRQLDLARELRLPVVAAALVPGPPSPREAGPGRGLVRDRERATRRLLAVLREAAVEPARVLVVGADERTVRAIRACGHLAGLSLDGEGLERAVKLVRALGPEGLVLGTDAGLAGADLLALARAADRLARAGLSEAVIRRVCGGNALGFLQR